MLEKLLGLPHENNSDLFDYLPVRTSVEQETEQLAKAAYEKHHKQEQTKQKPALKWGDFIPNEDSDNVKNDLIMLKLRNLVDHTQFKRAEESHKLPSKIQKGVIVEGDGFELKKLKKGKKHNSVIDYYLELDEKLGYSTRKFSEVQKIKQRRRRIKKSDVIGRKRRIAA